MLPLACQLIRLPHGCLAVEAMLLHVHHTPMLCLFRKNSMCRFLTRDEVPQGALEGESCSLHCSNICAEAAAGALGP